MFSTILLNKKNLIDNVLYLKEKSRGKLCVMVKSNAYGHGDKEIVEAISDYVDAFGVSNQREAFALRGKTEKPIIIFGACDDYFECMTAGIDFILRSFEEAKQVVKIYKNSFVKPKMHLCVNSGMNRYGVRSLKEGRKIITLLSKCGLKLEGIYTHFSSLTTDEEYTKKQSMIFEDFCALIPDDWQSIIHVGGGRSIEEYPLADMHRVGLYAYGYGDEHLKPVLSIKSQIVDIQKVRNGEHIGYLCGYTAQRNMTVATIPLGYGDGFPRKLSNNLEVKVNGCKVKNVGNICMDAFMVDVSDVKCAIGDEVIVFDDASEIADQLQTSEYEVLTNFTKLRGDKNFI